MEHVEAPLVEPDHCFASDLGVGTDGIQYPTE